jgi:hypothetical protein
MKDVDLIWECLIDKSYKDKIQLELLLNKIEDRKLAIGFLTDLWSKSSDWEVDKDDIVNLTATFLGEVPKKEMLIEYSSYFQTLMNNKNDRETEIAKFLVDFLTTLSTEISKGDNKGDFILSEIDTTKLEDILSEQKEKSFISDLKEKLLTMEMYEVLPLIDKYL